MEVWGYGTAFYMATLDSRLRGNDGFVAAHVKRGFKKL